MTGCSDRQSVVELCQADRAGLGGLLFRWFEKTHWGCCDQHHEEEEKSDCIEYKAMGVDRRRESENLETEVVGNIGNRMVYVHEAGVGRWSNPW